MNNLPLTIKIASFSRYYEKSIIKEEIEEQRSILNNHWDETKRSIRDARFRIRLESQKLEKKPKKLSINPFNGVHA